MDKDRIRGTAQQIAGSVKEILGRALGNKKMEAQGKAEKVAAKAQSLADSARDAARKSTEG